MCHACLLCDDEACSSFVCRGPLCSAWPRVQPAEKAKEPINETLKKAAWKATGGGLAGAGAMFINVGALMWMRTTVNFQYRYGMTTMEALSHLYNEGGRGLGGIRRFYRGVGPALFQGPLSRFGDTASNAGMMALWDSFETTQNLPAAAKTITASAAAAGFRVFLMPIDAAKTIMQGALIFFQAFVCVAARS